MPRAIILEALIFWSIMQAAIKESGVNPVSKMDWSQHISPEWVGEAIAWLASDAGRKYDGGDFSL
jgi:3-oxoacyl-[acyl-carrier protein] reductase